MDYYILHDNGYGITETSIQFFNKHRKLIGKVIRVSINKERVFAMEISGSNGVILLSGCTCGYGGTGPHGSIRILKSINPNFSREDEAKVLCLNHVSFIFQ